MKEGKEDLFPEELYEFIYFQFYIDTLSNENLYIDCNDRCVVEVRG